jgi:GNAT superfamily N-acetyltransferase
MEIDVREAKYSDLPFLVTNNLAMSVEAEGIELDSAILEMGVSAVFDDRERGVYLIAEVDGVPAGSLLVTKEWSDWRCSWYLWIQSLFVLPQFRRQGVYTALYKHVLECAYKLNAASVRLYVDRTNVNAIAAYEKLGMSKSHYDQYEIDTSGHTEE